MNEGIIEMLDKKQMGYKVLDCRTIEFVCSFQPEEIYIESTLVGLNINGWAINVGDNFNTWLFDSPHPYKIGFIEKVGDNKYIFLTHKRNRCSIYLTPCLRIKNEDRIFFQYDYYLINAYLDKDKLRLMYRFLPENFYKNTEHKLSQHELFCGCEDIGEYSILSFKFPLEYRDDIKLFIEGKYSKFSDKLKLSIMRFHGFNNHKGNRIIAVLNKYDWLKKRWEDELDMVLPHDIDLDSRPKLEEEEWLNIIK